MQSITYFEIFSVLQTNKPHKNLTTKTQASMNPAKKESY